MTHQRGSGVFNSLMPSHSCPVVAVPETRSKWSCSIMIAHSPRNGIFEASSKAAWLRGQSAYVTIARNIPTKIGVQNVATKSDVMFWTVRIAFIVDTFSAKICFFVVQLEINQRAEHLQVRDQCVHFRWHAGLAIKIARDRLRISFCERIDPRTVRISLRL